MNLRTVKENTHSQTFSQSCRLSSCLSPTSRAVTSDGAAHSVHLALSSKNESDQVDHQATEEKGNPPMTQPAGPGIYTALHPQSPAASELTILDGDLALPVIHPQHRFTLPPPLGHDANLPLAVIAVIGRVLAQGQSRLICWRKKTWASHTAVGNSHQERCPQWSLEQ